MMKVTLELPENLYEQARQWAAITQQDLDTALTDALTVALMPVHTDQQWDKPISTLSDGEVLTQAVMQMPTRQGKRLSKLLQKQRENSLSLLEHRELLALFQLYQRLWLRQAEALAESVSRGLRQPLSS